MNLAQYIDHTLLRPDAKKEDIIQLCNEAKEHGFAAVCIPPFFVKEAVKQLESSIVKVVTVIGFPMGYATTPAKVEEVKRAIDEEVDELDMVINLAAVKDKNWSYVRNDIDSVTRATHLKGKIVKVILETGLLEKEEIEKLCDICSELEVDYVKTSTGYNGEGVSKDVILLLRNLLPPEIRIKASGGIRSADFARILLEAGANRIGTSAGASFVS